MKLLLKLLGRAGDFSSIQPLPALFLGGAILAVFLTATMRGRMSESQPRPVGLLWTLYYQAKLLLWASFLVTCLLAGVSALRSYLNQTITNFAQSHGRVTQANYDAVQTIWGSEQTQGELKADLYYKEEVTNRIEFDDITKPAILKKETVRRTITENPFISARHSVTLTQNPRKKGSALYGGYETQCAFSWRLKNPEDRVLSADLKFPLPGSGAMFDDLTATLNGQDVLPQMEIKENCLVLSRLLQPGDTLDLNIGFKSRGMSYWYFQVVEPREIRDFTLALTLPDLAKARLNYPDDCMTPTDIQTTNGGRGTLLTYRLDHAISTKGMGISLPKLPQPGATTSKVLGATQQGWLLIIAMLAMGTSTLSSSRAVLVSLLFGAASALAYGLLGDFSDVLLGFWGTAVLILLPIFIVLAALLRRVLPDMGGKLVALQFILYGIGLPCLAGLDSDRESLYVDLCSVVLVAFVAWRFVNHPDPKELEPTAQPLAAG